MNRKWVIIPIWEDLDKSIELSNRYNTAFEYNDFFYPNVYMDESEVNNRINKYLSLGRDTSMDTVHGVFFDISPTSSDPVIKGHSLALMNQSMVIAKRLGCRGVVFHTGIISGLKLKSYQNGWLNGMEVVFKDLCNKYPSLDIYLENSLEQEPNLIIELANRMKSISNFKLCLDYAHAYLTTTNVCEWVKEFSPYLGHIHLNDNNGVEDLHGSCGTMNIDFNKFKELSDTYFNNIPILLEVKNNDSSEKSLEYMINLGE